MSDTGPFVDPRAAEVLCDVIRDPNATLLRMKNARVFAPTVAGGGAELLMPSCTQTAAEQELLRVYREETAYLLRLAYHERAMMPRKVKERGVLFFDSSWSCSNLSHEEIDQHMQFLLSWAGGGGEPSVETALLALRDPGTSMMDLACLSASFAPSTSAEGYIVEEYLLAQEGRSAIVACQRSLAKSMTTEWRSILATNLGVAYSICGEFSAAAACQRADVLENAPNEFGALNWALQASKTGEAVDLRGALEYIDSNWSASTPSLEQWFRLNAQQLQYKKPSVGPSSANMARALLPSVGEVGAKLLKFVIHAGTA